MYTTLTLKIFIGLQEIAGYFGSLNEGFKELNVDSTFINLRQHPFQYKGGDTPNFLIKAAKAIGYRIPATTKNLLQMPYRSLISAMFFLGLEQFMKIILFIWAVTKFDVFIFGANSTFLFYLDLPVLRLFRKTVIFVFLGSDSRPVYLNGSIVKESSPMSVKKIIALTKLQKRIIRWIDTFADVCINFAPQSHFHERPFISGIIVGLPFASAIKNRRKPAKRGEIVRILHAPSNPEVRGTPMIRSIIENLKKKGHNIDYVEITGKTHAKVIEEIIKCDFVVDELYSDTPLAGLGTEAAFFGKPVVNAGYYSEYIHKDVPKGYIPPAIYCSPGEIEQHVEKLIVNGKERKVLGKRAKEFVMKNWTPKKVAERYMRVIHGEISNDWWFDPCALRYPYGYGMSKKRVGNIIKDVVKRGGVRALQLADKPELEGLLLEFATDDVNESSLLTY